MSYQYASLVTLIVLLVSAGFFSGVELDNDGLNVFEELDAQTDPFDADTDNDRSTDDIELQRGSNPRAPDTDSDGLTDSTEYNGTTAVTRADTDGDELDDGRELSIGTSPTNSDTDGDGLIDGVEVREPDTIEGADPLRKDIFVEVDTTKPSVDRVAYRNIAAAYNNSPVENPDGTQGISVHFTFNDTQVPLSTLSYDDYREQRDTVFQQDGYGHYHILVIDTIEGNKDVVGRATSFGAIVEKQENTTVTGGVVMHELGHMFGIRPADYEGVDSTSVSQNEYPSAMSYSYIRECIALNETFRERNCESPYVYNDGEPFDDWDKIAASIDPNERCLGDKDSLDCE